MVRDGRSVLAVDGRDFIKSPASMNVAGVAGYTVSCYRGRTFDARHTMINKKARINNI